MHENVATHMFVVLLTNRVHPTAANEQIRQFRPQLHDLIVKTLDD